MAKVKRLIKDDPRMTENEIKGSFNISSGSLNQILRHHLSVWKRCKCWKPHQLTEEWRRGKVEWCLCMHRQFNGGRSKWVWNNSMVKETFVYPYHPETKQQSSVYWLFPGESRPVKLKTARSTSRQMIAVFFPKSGHVASVPPQERKTVNAEWYVKIGRHKVFGAWSVLTIQTMATVACCSTMTM